MAKQTHGTGPRGLRAERVFAMAAALALHAGFVLFARIESALPAAVADSETTLVFLLPPPVQPSRPLPHDKPAAAANGPAAQPPAVRAAAAMQTVAAPHAAATASPSLSVVELGHADDHWGTPPGAASAPPDLRRDPLGRRKPDLVAVATPQRFRMRKPLSVHAVLRMLAPAGYETTPCPDIQRNIDGLIAAGDASSRRQLEEELMRDEDFCR